MFRRDPPSQIVGFNLPEWDAVGRTRRIRPPDDYRTPVKRAYHAGD
ncbi:hypothetical protein [Nonomuraea sp. JJY05]